MLNDDWQVFFRLRCMFTPITIDWRRYTSGELIKTTITWRALYLFGVRVARWRVSDD